MKRIVLISGMILLAILLASHAPRALAAADASCAVSTARAAIGTNVVFTCGGFDPNTVVFPYYVQPDGAAEAGPLDYAYPTKTDAQGVVTFVFPTGGDGSFTFGVGKWTLVVEQLGLGHTVVHRAEASVIVTGGTEGVSGAVLRGSADSVFKGEDWAMYGSGFAPFEIVTIWGENPNGECSTYAFNTGVGFNYYNLDGVDTFQLGDIKADGAGNFVADFGHFFPADCQGKWHFVARGNASKRGGDTFVTVKGLAVKESASLVADKNPVRALFDTLSFHGSGYAAGEHITCWTTDPQGRAVVLGETKADAGGNMALSWYTGSLVPGLPVTSQGPLGEWAATCKGDSSGAIGIARYVLVGNVVDP